MHPLPNQYKGKAYTAVLFTFINNEDDVNCHYVAYTANHYNVWGRGETRPKAIDELREKILVSINDDIEGHCPVEFCADIIPQITDRFMAALIANMQANPIIHILQVDEIVLTPF